MHNKTDIDLIFESYSKARQIAPDFDAMFNKVYDRLPESQVEVDDFRNGLDTLDKLRQDHPGEVDNIENDDEAVGKFLSYLASADYPDPYDALMSAQPSDEPEPEHDRGMTGRAEDPRHAMEDAEEDAEGDDFPSLQKGQRVYVTLTDGSELQGVLDFDGVDLARSNMFAIDDGEEIGVEYISDVGPVSTEDSEESESNVYERLEEFMETVDDDTVDYLRQILTDFEAIITDINALEAPDQKIDAVDLGIHLDRLSPFTNI